MSENNSLHYRHSIRIGKREEYYEDQFEIPTDWFPDEPVEKILELIIEREPEIFSPLQDILNGTVSSVTIYEDDSSKVEAHMIDSALYMRCFAAPGHEQEIDDEAGRYANFALEEKDKYHIQNVEILKTVEQGAIDSIK